MNSHFARPALTFRGIWRRAAILCTVGISCLCGTARATGSFSLGAVYPQTWVGNPTSPFNDTIGSAITEGFDAAISLSATVSPSGQYVPTVSLNPTTIGAPGSGSSTMAITVGTSVPVGIYTITVTGTAGSTQASTTVTVHVPEPAPTTFTLTAPSSGPGSCTGAQQGYTCSASNNAVNVQINNAQDSVCNGLTEHYQYCLVQGVNLNGSGLIPPSDCGTGNPWTTTPPATYTLNSGNGVYTVYAEYALSCGGQSYMSYPALFQITLNNSPPAAMLNTPSGIPASSAYGYGQQTQYLNFAVPQGMTYWAAGPVPPLENVTAVDFYGCSTAPSSCSSPASLGATPTPNSTVPPYVWSFSGLTAADSYVWLTVIDQSGETNQAVSPATSFFQPTNSGTPTPLAIACGVANSGGTQTCLPVADGTGVTGANTISNDPPSPAAAVPVTYMGQNGTVTQLFSGYADPSVRLDPYFAGATGGGYLWMLYSSPRMNQYTNTGNNPTIPYYGATVETHRASSVPASSGSSADSSGLSWSGYCSGGCVSNPITPIYPSVPIPGAPTQTYSSHEVPNFWPYAVSGQTETWYAVHLMYFVTSNTTGVPNDIPTSIETSGNACLVISSAQNTPANLAWQTSQQPSSCTGALPNGPSSTSVNNYLQFSDLAAITQNYGCASWGQPAIMVTSALSGGTPTIYLAVSCFNSNFVPLGSYVLSTTCLNLDWGTSGSTCGNQTAQQDWTVTAVEFGWDQVAGLPGVPSAYPGGSPSFTHAPNYITELDWAVRADNSVVAVLTFGYNPNSTGQMPTSYGCLALNFNPLASTNNPFSFGLPTNAYSGVIAYIWDNDASPPTNTSEVAGPGACTYEPNSNAGILIDRQLGGKALDPFPPPPFWPPSTSTADFPPCGMNYCPYSTYSIVPSGVFP